MNNPDIKPLFSAFVRSESIPDRRYKVELKRWGRGFRRVHCDCPDFHYRQRDCKHIKATKNFYKKGL